MDHRLYSRREMLAALAASPALAASRRRPNIVFVLGDDLGWGELGCYGNTFNRTPNLDRLAASGTRFTNAYSAAPVCSPTRASIMTGQCPARVGINDYLRADDPKYLDPSILTLPKMLSNAGYETAIVGKWHLMGDYKKRPGDPALHGFKHVICSESAYIGPGYYFHPYKHLPGLQARTEHEYLTDRLNQEAVDFISANKEKPFFLYLAHYAPHTNLVGKPEKVEKYRKMPGAGKNRNNPELAAMIESMDEGIGMISAKLDELKLTDNTIFVFNSDNGGETTVTTNDGLHGGKSQLYEGGIRVPLIVRAPGRTKAGAVSDEPVSSIDYYSTFLEAAGVKPPAGHKVDGASLFHKGSLQRDLCWHYPLDKPHFLGGRSASAIRSGNKKLIEFYDSGECELYDLAADPSETKDIAASSPAEVARLQSRLAAWRKSVGANSGR